MWETLFIGIQPLWEKGISIEPAQIGQAEIFWEDYSILYISSQAALADAVGNRYVRLAAEEAERNGLFVCADLRGPAAHASWGSLSAIVWTDTGKTPVLSGDQRISLIVGQESITAVTKNGELSVTPGTSLPEQFMMGFIQALSQGLTLEEALTRR